MTTETKKDKFLRELKEEQHFWESLLQDTLVSGKDMTGGGHGQGFTMEEVYQRFLKRVKQDLDI